MGYDRGTVFLSISNQMEFHLVQNRKKNCHHDHIPLNLKGNGIRVFQAGRQQHGPDASTHHLCCSVIQQTVIDAARNTAVAGQ